MTDELQKAVNQRKLIVEIRLKVIKNLVPLIQKKKKTREKRMKDLLPQAMSHQYPTVQKTLEINQRQVTQQMMKKIMAKNQQRMEHPFKVMINQFLIQKMMK